LFDRAARRYIATQVPVPPPSGRTHAYPAAQSVGTAQPVLQAALTQA